MSITDQIYEVVKPLPEPLALEALHFIEYLSSKTSPHPTGCFNPARLTP